MSWDTDFEEFMQDEVIREPYASQNGYGVASYGTAETIKCRVEHKPKIIRRTGGGEASGTVQEIVSKATIYCAGVFGWGERDRITLPDGSQPLILQVHTSPDEDGPHHDVVFV